jgi:hypothetical protein
MVTRIEDNRRPQHHPPGWLCRQGGGVHTLLEHVHQGDDPLTTVAELMRHEQAAYARGFADGDARARREWAGFGGGPAHFLDDHVACRGCGVPHMTCVVRPENRCCPECDHAPVAAVTDAGAPEAFSWNPADHPAISVAASLALLAPPPSRKLGTLPCDNPAPHPGCGSDDPDPGGGRGCTHSAAWAGQLDDSEASQEDQR